jgi:predicted TIM-barrel fold metal-dependent hydrolase
VRRSGGGWVLRLAGEPDSAIDPSAHEIEARAAVAGGDGVDVALVSLSSAIGVEALPRAEAAPLLDAWADSVRDLPAPFRAWAAVSVADPDPGELEARLDQGASGLTLPAGELGTPEGLERLAPLLDALERRDAPLFVHPGPARGQPVASQVPSWWPAMTAYVADMNAAWHAFLAFGRAQHPRLRIVFAMLAGLAPLHLERLRARGGPSAAAIDRDVFLDTSSYGPRAIDAVVRQVGIDQLVYGSDRPVVEPIQCPLGEAARHATLVTNPARLMGVAA